MTLDLRFAGRGIGGADDARERARDDRVSFGVLRCCLGRGTFARWKSVLMHFNPDGASIVARGRANAMKAAVEARRRRDRARARVGDSIRRSLARAKRRADGRAADGPTD